MKVLTSGEVMNMTGLSRITIWRYEKANSFPKRRQLGTRRVGWIESEIRDWLESRPKVDKGSEVKDD